jgi:uncharacterized protein (UPF0335 family)
MTGSAQTSNGFDTEKTKSFVNRVEEIEREIDSERGSFMAKCKALRDDINDVLEEAKEAGLPRKALRKVLQSRKLERKVEAIREDLESEDQDSFDLIRLALGDLGDLPLGQTVLDKKAAKQKQASANLDELVD